MSKTDGRSEKMTPKEQKKRIALEEYHKIAGSAHKDYRSSVKQARKAYDKKRKSAFGEYKKIALSALTEYEKKIKEIDEEYEVKQ